MKKMLALASLFFLLFSSSAYAGEGIKSVGESLSGIMLSQGVSSINQIDCKKVAEQQFGELGDALMEQMHPGEAHEAMDAMMGGEGSETLESVHASMGKSYLRCNGFGMMSAPMGPWMMWGNNFQPPFVDYSILWLVLAVLAASIALNIYLASKAGGNKK